MNSIERGFDTPREGGIMTFVLPSAFLDGEERKIKDKIAGIRQAGKLCVPAPRETFDGALERVSAAAAPVTPVGEPSAAAREKSRLRERGGGTQKPQRGHAGEPKRKVQ